MIEQESVKSMIEHIQKSVPNFPFESYANPDKKEEMVLTVTGIPMDECTDFVSWLTSNSVSFYDIPLRESLGRFQLSPLEISRESGTVHLDVLHQTLTNLTIGKQTIVIEYLIDKFNSGSGLFVSAGLISYGHKELRDIFSSMEEKIKKAYPESLVELHEVLLAKQ